MAKNARNGDPIDRLLQERQQYATWLSRLDATADSAPESVLGRVRTDYQGRLTAVIEQLRSHADDLAQQLERHRETRGELLTREAQAKEIMSEAEVRHAVGEYDDGKWQQIRGEAQKNLVAIREDLSQLGEEISELEKVQQLISAPAIPEPVAPPPSPQPEPVRGVEPAPPLTRAEPVSAQAVTTTPVATPEPPASVADEPAAEAPPAAPAAPNQTTARPAAAVRPVKPKENTPTPGRTLWFPSVKEEEINAGVDELAFLKSVSEDESMGPSHKRASGGLPRPVEATPPAPTPQPSAMSSTAGERSSTSTGARTLKCGECGTMNRPTEWYCERCGAELADL
jgi:hypothetical protein